MPIQPFLLLWKGEKRGRTKRVDDTFLLFCDALRTADPLAAIAKHANALDMVGTLECWDEKVPYVDAT